MMRLRPHLFAAQQEVPLAVTIFRRCYVSSIGAGTRVKVQAGATDSLFAWAHACSPETAEYNSPAEAFRFRTGDDSGHRQVQESSDQDHVVSDGYMLAFAGHMTFQYASSRNVNWFDLFIAHDVGVVPTLEYLNDAGATIPAPTGRDTQPDAGTNWLSRMLGRG